MLLHTRRNPLHNLTRQQHPPRLAPKAVALEGSTSLGLALDIDELVASPWIGLHYRHEFLLHHRHELLEPVPNKRAGHPESTTLADVAARPKLEPVSGGKDKHVAF